MNLVRYICKTQMQKVQERNQNVFSTNWSVPRYIAFWVQRSTETTVSGWGLMKFQNKTNKKIQHINYFLQKGWAFMCIFSWESPHPCKSPKGLFLPCCFFLNKEKKIQIKLPRPEDGETTTFSEGEPLCPDDQEQILQNWNCRSVTVLKLCMVTS